MKPKGATEHEEGLLEYLEDIIGTNKLVTLIASSAAALEDLTERTNERHLRVRVAKQECDALTGPKDTAVAFLRAQNDLAVARSQEAVLRARQAEGVLARERAGIATLEQRLSELCLQHERDSAALQGMQDEASRKDEAVRKADQETASLASRLQSLELRDIKCRTKREELLKRRSAVAERLKKLSDSGDAETLEEIQQEITASLQQELSLDAELADARTLMDAFAANLKSRAGDLQAEIDRLEASLGPAKDAIREQRRSLTLAKEALNLARSRANSRQNQLGRIDEELVKLQQEQERTISEKRTLHSQHSALTQKHQSIQGEIKVPLPPVKTLF